MGIYIGIDLGTTMSAAAYIDSGGKPRIIPNKEGERLTPSVVLFEGTKVLVGARAKSRTQGKEHAVSFAKREMGNRQMQYAMEAETYSPEEISAFVLKKIKQDAEEKTGEEVLGAVVTVPAYFTDAQRVATEQAAAMAGLSILAMINEPTAAALAYGIVKGGAKPRSILVYDLGGGTFDVSIMRIADQNIEILSTMGAPRLGGYDFDKKIADWFMGEAKKQGADPGADAQTEQRLLLEAERVKKELSAGDFSEMELTVDGQRIRASLTREEFENMIEPLIYDTTVLMEGAVEEANLNYTDLDKILLIGGSTRIPLVRQMIEEETGITPVMEVNPDEAVAVGAAYHAVNVVKQATPAKTLPGEAPKQNASQAPPVMKKAPRNSYGEPVVIDQKAVPKEAVPCTFQDRTSHGIGIVAKHPSTGREQNVVLVKKNTPVPAKARMDFVTNSENQRELELLITQGEDKELQYTTVIGKSHLKLKPRPKGSPIRIIIGCDTNFVTRIQVMDLTDKTNLGEMTIDRTANLTETEVQETKKKIGRLDIG